MESSPRSARAAALLASWSLAFASACHTTHVHTSAPPTAPQPVEHSPVIVVTKYTYVHYPSCNVYCDRERKLWFWFDAGQWKFGAVLPAHYHVVEGEAVTIELERDTPYEHASQPVVELGPSPRGHAYGLHHTFTYIRYPTFNVYCDRERKLWFWYESGAWKSGAQLPAHFRVDAREAVKVELESDTPFEHGNAHRHDEGNGSAKNHGGDARSTPSEVGAKSWNGRSKGNDSNRGRDTDDDATPANERGKSQDRGASKSKNASNSIEDSRGNAAADDSSKRKGDAARDDKARGWTDKSNGLGNKDRNNAPSDGKANGSSGKNAAGDKKGRGGAADTSKADNGKGAKGKSNDNSSSEEPQGSGDPSKGNGEGKNSSNGGVKSSGKDKAQKKDAESNDKGSGADSSDDSKNDDDSKSDASGTGKGKGKGKGKG